MYPIDVRGTHLIYRLKQPPIDLSDFFIGYLDITRSIIQDFPSVSIELIPALWREDSGFNEHPGPDVNGI